MKKRVISLFLIFCLILSGTALAGGSVDRVVDALIAAQSAQIPLEFEQSRAIDLAGRNVLEAVKMSTYRKR